MSIDEQLEAYLYRVWGEVIDQLRQWYDDATHHGCFCGAGQRGTEPVDELDGCCQRHDQEYQEAGIAAETMWSSPDAFVAGRQADVNLVNCASAAATDADVYREALIGLFSRRVDIADAVLWYRDRLEKFRGWLGAARERLLADGTVPPDIAAEYAQYVAYLEAEGIEGGDLVAAVEDTGLDADAMTAPGSTGSAEPTALA